MISDKNNYPKEGHSWYVLVILLLVYIFSYIDRTILVLLVDPIKSALDITDTELSILHGFAFAIFYTFLGIPMGWLADKGNRLKIVRLSTYVWSFATIITGFCNSFFQMFIARIGLGVGESALSPAVYSLLSDYFKPEKLSRALSFYNAGLFIGSGLALVIGGFLIDLAPGLDLPFFGYLEPWRVTFIIVGLPGILLALWLVRIPEPRRLGLGSENSSENSLFSFLSKALSQIRRQPEAYLYHFFGFSFYAFIWAGTAAWIPSHFIRNFQWSASQVGSSYGVLVVLFGLLGVTSGGFLCGKLRMAGFKDAEIRTGFIGILFTFPFGVLAPLTSNTYLALIGFAGLTFFASFPWGAATAALQIITPNRLRAIISGFFLFLINMAGIGIAPTVIALITDFGFGYDAAVRYSLSIVVGIAAPISCFLLWLGLKPYKNAIEDI